jgi:hypothetical protein
MDTISYSDVFSNYFTTLYWLGVNNSKQDLKFHWLLFINRLELDFHTILSFTPHLCFVVLIEIDDWRCSCFLLVNEIAHLFCQSVYKCTVIQGHKRREGVTFLCKNLEKKIISRVEVKPNIINNV